MMRTPVVVLLMESLSRIVATPFFSFRLAPLSQLFFLALATDPNLLLGHNLAHVQRGDDGNRFTPREYGLGRDDGSRHRGWRLDPFMFGLWISRPTQHHKLGTRR
jgi:hypothetical protein